MRTAFGVLCVRRLVSVQVDGQYVFLADTLFGGESVK